MKANVPEFGNYIGADLDSGEESDDFDIGQTSAAGPSGGVSAGAGAGGDFAPLEGLEEEEEAEDDDMDGDRDGVGMEMTLHGVDGECRELLERVGSCRIYCLASMDSIEADPLLCFGRHTWRGARSSREG
jgi:hypothetical protein